MTWAFEQFHLIGLAENLKRQYTKVVSDRVGTNRQKNKRPWAVIVLLCSCRAKQLVLHIRKKSPLCDPLGHLCTIDPEISNV